MEALRDPSIAFAVATLLDPPHAFNVMCGPELTHEEERDLDTALRVLEEAT